MKLCKNCKKIENRTEKWTDKYDFCCAPTLIKFMNKHRLWSSNPEYIARKCKTNKQIAKRQAANRKLMDPYYKWRALNAPPIVHI